MADPTSERNLQIVGGFMRDSPPGEINDVFNDVRVLLDDETLLETGAPAMFEEYNIEQYTTITPPGQKYQIVLSPWGRIDESRYLDPRASQVFAVDHIRLTSSDPQDVERNQDSEDHRAALDDAASKYIAEHYPDGVATVYDGNELVLLIVDNKYNPDNFWNGRWRSQWIAQPSTGELKGLLRVTVHYYEDGNVQLTANKDISINVGANPDPRAFAASVLRHISKNETEFQNALSDKFAALSDSVFKGLRRALPITRNKINWESIAAYKIGSELHAK
ncbi:F-actin-capping protein subunit alpha [Phlyctochytrium arcticum]|nr:F-actin-capping protein subunit alpha [Phlyctochytrium arcticum]